MCTRVLHEVIILNAHLEVSSCDVSQLPCRSFNHPKPKMLLPPRLQVSADVQMLVFNRICVCVHREMERREEEEEEEMEEEKRERCDDDDSEGDEDEETAGRSDDDAKEGVKATRGGGGGEDEGSDGYKEQNDEDEGENPSVETKVSVGRASCPGQKCIPGIIYLGHIPPRLRPKHLRNMLSSYGEVGRIFLQPEGREAFPGPCGLPGSQSQGPQSCCCTP